MEIQPYQAKGLSKGEKVRRNQKRGHSRRYFGTGPSRHIGIGPIAMRCPDPDDGDGGGGGGGVDLNDPKVKAAIAEAVGTETSGLKAKNTELLGLQATLKEQVNELSAQWSGLDPDAVRALIKQLDSDEDTKLIAEGKFDEVLGKRTEAMRKDWETKLTASTAKIDTLMEQLAGRDGQIHSLRVDHSIRAACAESGVTIPGAIDDAVSLARSVFQVNEGGELEARDAAGGLLLGKDATTPIQPVEWLEARKTDREHWWGTSGGGGAGGGSHKGGDDQNNVDGMSSRDKLKAGLAGQ